jgi:hypothetical protein
MDADSSDSADFVLRVVPLSAPRSHPPPARPRRATRAEPQPVGQVHSTPERTADYSFERNSLQPPSSISSISYTDIELEAMLFNIEALRYMNPTSKVEPAISKFL